MSFARPLRRILAALPVVAAVLLLGASSVLLGVCGPFTDVAADSFCPFVLEIFTLGITTGTSPTTYDPASPVSRLQMAAFLSRTVDGVLRRGSRHAAVSRFWTPQNENVIGLTTVGALPRLLRSDGADIWTAVQGPATVTRVRASDGKLLQTWTGVSDPFAVLVAAGLVIVTGDQDPGKLYTIDPRQPAGAATLVASNLGKQPEAITFDGARVWTANRVVPATVSIVTPGAAIPWTVTTVTTGFTRLQGAVFDGNNVWVSDSGVGKLFKLDSAGAILLTVTVGLTPLNPVFDGTNIWVPNNNPGTLSVVRAATGAVVQTLTGNGLAFGSTAAAFDGERILVTNQNTDSVSLWKAADLTPLGSFSTGAGTTPFGICSDGLHFWVGLLTPGEIARF
jgi:hypothetical protein